MLSHREKVNHNGHMDISKIILVQIMLPEYLADDLITACIAR